MRTMRTTFDFHEFERLHEIDEEIMGEVAGFLRTCGILPDSTGTLRFTIEYLETVEPVPEAEKLQEAFSRELHDFLRADFIIHPGSITKDQIANGEWRKWAQ